MLREMILAIRFINRHFKNLSVIHLKLKPYFFWWSNFNRILKHCIVKRLHHQLLQKRVLQVTQRRENSTEEINSVFFYIYKIDKKFFGNIIKEKEWMSHMRGFSMFYKYSYFDCIYHRGKYWSFFSSFI